MGAGPLALLGDGDLSAALAGVVDHHVTVVDETGLADDEIGAVLEICARTGD
jgi:hypothetical protein